MDKSEALNKRQGSNSNNNSNTRPTGNPMDKTNFRSLICDESGIIIGEMVYRCLICSFISVSMDKIRAHYQTEHEDIEDISNGEFRYVSGDYCPSPSNDPFNDDQQKATSTKANQQANEPDGDAEPEEQRSSGITGSGSCGNKSRSGYITCRICTSTRFYSYVQRRYGQYTCYACYRHFREFLLKRKVFSCPNLGSCSLEVKIKCPACWLKACINIFNGSVGDKQYILETFKPVKRQRNVTIKEEENEVEEEVKGNNEEGEDDEEDVEEEEEEEEIDEETEVDYETERVDKEDNHVDVYGDKLDDKSVYSSFKRRSTNKLESPSGYTYSKLQQKASARRSTDDFGNQFDDNNNPNVREEDEEDEEENGSKGDSQEVESLPAKRKRNWSCMKCTNCLKQECGKCVYCLDRPKYGGQFRLRQRCANRRCLLKLKDL